MKRRTWIQTALAVPAAVALPASAQEPAAPARRDEFAKIETAPSAEQAAEPALKFFSNPEFVALERLAAAIMPSIDGKPGAIEAGVPAFLDFLISQSPAARQKLYRDGLARLNAGGTLASLSEPWTYKPPTDSFKRFLREAKSDLLQATFNSREWIEARTNGRGGAGTYYLAVD